MHRYDSAVLLLLLTGACGGEDGPRTREEDGGAVSVGDAGPDRDGSLVDAGASDAAPGGDGGGDSGVEADGAAPGGDGGLPPLDGSLFGPAPFARRELPVRRLALGRGAGLFCVVLADRSLYCEEDGTNVTSRVPDNRDFVWLDAPQASNDYAAIRSDGSTTTFSQSFDTATDFKFAGAGFTGLFKQADASCALRSDGSVQCQGKTFPTTIPDGPFVQIFGAYRDAFFMGLRSDGVLVTSRTGQQGVISADRRFSDFDGYSDPGCAQEASTKKLFCFQYAPGNTVLQVERPFSNVRDYAQGLGELCVIQRDGLVACLAANGGPSKSLVPTDKRFVDITTIGSSQTCGVTEQGELWCWGDRPANAAHQIPLPMPAAVN